MDDTFGLGTGNRRIFLFHDVQLRYHGTRHNTATSLVEARRSILFSNRFNFTLNSDIRYGTYGRAFIRIFIDIYFIVWHYSPLRDGGVPPNIGKIKLGWKNYCNSDVKQPL